MATIDEIRTQVNQAKQVVAEQKEKAKKSKEMLEKQQKSLPNYQTQRQLRQGAFSGMKGRDKRRKIKEASGKIGQALSGVKSQEAQLISYEEQNIAPAEAQIADYDAKQRAIESVNKAIARGEWNVAMIAQYGEGYEKQYAEDYLQGVYAQRDYLEGLTDKINTGGVESLNAFDKKKFDVLKSKGIIEMKEVIVDTTDLSRTERNKIVAPMIDSIKSNALVSQQGGGINNVTNGNFGNNLRVGSESPSRNNFISSIFGNSSDFKKSFQEETKKGSYTSALGVFTAPTYDLGAGGTLSFIRTPTPTEQARFQQVAVMGDKFKDTLLGKRELGQNKINLNNRTFKIDEIASKYQGNVSLPYGLQSTPETISGQKFNVWNSPMWVGRQVQETRAGQRAETYIQNQTEFGRRGYANKTSNVLAPIIAETPKLAFFSPLLATGTSGTKSGTKQISEQLSKNKFEALTKKLAKIEKDVASKGSSVEQTKYLNELAGQIDKNNPQAIKEFKEFVQYLYEKGVYKGVPSGNQVPRNNQNILDINIQGNIPNMKNVGIFGEVLPKESIKKSILEPNIKTTQILEPQMSNQGINLFASITQKGRQGQTTKPSQNIFSNFKQNQATISTTGQKFSWATATGQSSLFKQSQTTGQKLTQKTPTKQRPKPEEPIKKTPRLWLQSLAKKAESNSNENNLFQVVGRRFGKDFSLLKTKDKVQAQEKLFGFLKGTLGRSGKILKDGKEIPFKELGLFQNQEFRQAKKDPFRVVQKSKFSLSSASEVKEIQFFKSKSKKKRKFSFF